MTKRKTSKMRANTFHGEKRKLFCVFREILCFLEAFFVIKENTTDYSGYKNSKITFNS